jgi:hypothetical protein
MQTKTNLIAAAALMAVAAGVKADTFDSITLTNGGASLTMNNLRNHQLDTLGGQGSLDWYGSNMKQLWFWYRVQGHGREWAISRQEADCWKTDSSAYLHYKENIPGALKMAEFRYYLYLTRPTANKVQLQVNWYMKNLMQPVAGDNGTRTMRMYTYTDIDAGAAPGQNNATLDATLKKFTITRGNSTMNFESAYDAPSFYRSQHGYVPSGSLSPILDQLSDSTDEDLSQSAVGGFGPGDWNGAFEHVKTLASNETTSGTFYIDVNLPSKIVHPYSATVEDGYHFSGDLVSLMNDDGNYFSILPEESAGQGQIYFYGQTSAFFNPSSLEMKAVFKTQRPGQLYNWLAMNYDTGFWTAIGGGNALMADQTVQHIVPAVNTPSKYIDNYGFMKMRLQWSPVNDEDPSQDGWLDQVDEVTWTVNP